MNTTGPLDLPRDEAEKIEHDILMLQPFSHLQPPRYKAWENAVENYLILRWALGLGPASVREIVEALKKAQFRYARDRTVESCCGTVRGILWDDKFLVTDSSERRWIRYNPVYQYAWRPNRKSND